jgi:DNA-binding CsgD family transcriptional regulator
LRGEPEAALEDFLLVKDTLAAIEADNPTLAPWRSLAGVALHRLGDTRQGLSLIDEEFALAKAFGLPAQVGVALRRRAQLEHSSRAERTLNQAVEALQQADAPLELARALAGLGSAQRRAGRGKACREPLRRALDLAHRCGATAIEEQAREELLASGARPRNPVLTGIGSLTPSERRIAELAAAGRSNAEIGDLLFLTKNTVGWHLVHAYRKLDINSRSELRSLFDTEPQ